MDRFTYVHKKNQETIGGYYHASSFDRDKMIINKIKNRIKKDKLLEGENDYLDEEQLTFSRNDGT